MEHTTNSPEQPYWLASQLSEAYGYKDFTAFKKVVVEAIKVMIDLDMPYFDHIIPRQSSRYRSGDFLLSRFACWIVSLQSDRKKTGVQSAREKLSPRFASAGIAEEDIWEATRIPLREELGRALKRLARATKRAGIQDYVRFHDAGYRGFYDHSKAQLFRLRRINEDGKLFDFMGSMELSANILRVNLTGYLIRSRSLEGQDKLERAAQGVGQRLRKVVHETTGKFPEELNNRPNVEALKRKIRTGLEGLEKSRNASIEGE